MLARALLCLTVAALTACDASPPPPVAQAERLPDEVCRQAKEALDKSVAQGAVVLNSPTDAVVPREAWFAISPQARDALQTAMALAAVCAGAPRLEQAVTVHSDEGEVMSRKTVKTSYSTAEALSL